MSATSPAGNPAANPDLEAARRVLTLEAEGLRALASGLDGGFALGQRARGLASAGTGLAGTAGLARTSSDTELGLTFNEP